MDTGGCVLVGGRSWPTEWGLQATRQLRGVLQGRSGEQSRSPGPAARTRACPCVTRVFTAHGTKTAGAAGRLGVLAEGGRGELGTRGRLHRLLTGWVSDADPPFQVLAGVHSVPGRVLSQRLPGR